MMKQGRMFLTLCAALGLIAAAVPPAHAARKPAAAATADAPQASKNLRQFTGFVTALDKSTFTVERRGKKPKTMVFAKHAEMKSSGELEKDARVTVYYRDESGHLVAHRIVVKSTATAAAGER